MYSTSFRISNHARTRCIANWMAKRRPFSAVPETLQDNIPRLDTTNWIERHGPDDSTVTVTVSDKDFITLKSTLQLSPVIWDALLRAEEQQEQQHEGSTTKVFLDRDPKHFPIILAYLRNRVEDLSYNRECGIKPVTQKTLTKRKFKHKYLFDDEYTKYIQLPKDADPDDLEDLYLEATFYQLEDLQTQLAHGTMAVRAFHMIRGGTGRTNPFEQAKDLVKMARNTSAALAVLGSGAMALFTDTTNAVTPLLSMAN